LKPVSTLKIEVLLPSPRGEVRCANIFLTWKKPWKANGIWDMKPMESHAISHEKLSHYVLLMKFNGIYRKPYTWI
jgi:hypothetical protein